MTRKDYETVAACLGGELARTSSDDKTVWSLFDRLALEFELDNPNFKKAKFEAAVNKWAKSHGGR